jgi:rRNA maturation endonuclease Nob1
VTDTFETFAAGPAECHACGWKWHAVWPLGAADLECKRCGSKDTEREQTRTTSALDDMDFDF